MQSWRTAEALDQGHRRGDGEGAEPGYSDSVVSFQRCHEGLVQLAGISGCYRTEDGQL